MGSYREAVWLGEPGPNLATASMFRQASHLLALTQKDMPVLFHAPLAERQAYISFSQVAEGL